MTHRTCLEKTTQLSNSKEMVTSRGRTAMVIGGSAVGQFPIAPGLLKPYVIPHFKSQGHVRRSLLTQIMTFHNHTL